MSLTTEGRNALEQIAEWLEAGAPHVDHEGRTVDHFNMEYPVSKDGPECGTTCCIAGALVQFNGLDDRDLLEATGNIAWYTVKRLAVDFLDIGPATATELFEPWVYFDGADDSFNDPKRAAKVLRHYLETGRVDWDLFPNEATE